MVIIIMWSIDEIYAENSTDSLKVKLSSFDCFSVTIFLKNIVSTVFTKFLVKNIKILKFRQILNKVNMDSFYVFGSF